MACGRAESSFWLGRRTGKLVSEGHTVLGPSSMLDRHHIESGRVPQERNPSGLSPASHAASLLPHSPGQGSYTGIPDYKGKDRAGGAAHW